MIDKIKEANKLISRITNEVFQIPPEEKKFKYSEKVRRLSKFDNILSSKFLGSAVTGDITGDDIVRKTTMENGVKVYRYYLNREHIASWINGLGYCNKPI